MACPEYLTMVECTVELTADFSNNLQHIANILHSKHLISPSVKDEALQSMFLPANVRAGKVVSVITNRVQIQPEAFNEIVSVLDPQYYSLSLGALRSRYKKNGGKELHLPTETRHTPHTPIQDGYPSQAHSTSIHQMPPPYSASTHSSVHTTPVDRIQMNHPPTVRDLRDQYAPKTVETTSDELACSPRYQSSPAHNTVPSDYNTSAVGPVIPGKPPIQNSYPLQTPSLPSHQMPPHYSAQTHSTAPIENNPLPPTAGTRYHIHNAETVHEISPSTLSSRQPTSTTHRTVPFTHAVQLNTCTYNSMQQPVDTTYYTTMESLHSSPYSSLQSQNSGFSTRETMSTLSEHSDYQPSMKFRHAPVGHISDPPPISEPTFTPEHGTPRITEDTPQPVSSTYMLSGRSEYQTSTNLSQSEPHLSGPPPIAYNVPKLSTPRVTEDTKLLTRTHTTSVYTPESQSKIGLDWTPEVKDLLRLERNGKSIPVIARVAAEWESVALSLDIERYIMRTIKYDHGSTCEGACRNMFERWLASEGKGPKSWRTIVEALEDSQENETALMIRELLGD